jgi:hypothetical protein
VSTITIELLDEDLAFLRSWSKEHATSVEALLAQQVRNLREQVQRPLHPDVVAATGIISPDVNAGKAYHEYIEKKYTGHSRWILTARRMPLKIRTNLQPLRQRKQPALVHPAKVTKRRLLLLEHHPSHPARHIPIRQHKAPA